MKHQRDRLKQYQKKIQAILSQEHVIAVDALKAGNKTRALTALRRRQYQEGLLQKTDGQLEVLENLVSSVEFALIEKDVMFGLKQGNEVLKQIHTEMDIESVHKLMSDTAEAIQYQQEIGEALMSTMTAEEEESVQNELAELQAQALPAIPEVQRVELPTVPVSEPMVATDVDREIEKTPAARGEVALEA
ncbi:Vacuolar protein sorting-associated protein 20 [Tulasnella sp. 330]|nr:Vacuolar protein sorting-associated protein 20 [Tulasnella sp. 330]KAG8883673.1 Vacuolar protein sorting-associated protein 20 [Tulasnella sp. 332]